ncbi:class I adenylate-forming enzyme family protein [Streptomyces tibetensis]|uniref:class I adenylate-forming enzyme family protein n=1 Tax=Streptomyces tibetensis TaxID=2382123 RepID=UPI0033E773FE
MITWRVRGATGTGLPGGHRCHLVPALGDRGSDAPAPQKVPDRPAEYALSPSTPVLAPAQSHWPASGPQYAELQHVLLQSGAVGLLLTDSFRDTDMAAAVERIRPRLPRLREQSSFTGWLTEIRRTRVIPLPRVAPGSAAQIQYTSGTTGTPKGAVLHHRGLVTNAAFTAARAGFPHQGTWVSALPLFHTAGWRTSMVISFPCSRNQVCVQR